MWPEAGDGRIAGEMVAKESRVLTSERSLEVRWAGRSEGAAGTLARHSHEGVETWVRTREGVETIASARDA